MAIKPKPFKLNGQNLVEPNEVRRDRPGKIAYIRGRGEWYTAAEVHDLINYLHQLLIYDREEYGEKD